MAESQGMKRVTTIAAGLAAATALAACGSSSTSSSNAAASTNGTTTAPPAGTTTGTGTTSTSATSTGTTTTAGIPTCVAADLALSYIGGQGATGHGELGFALRNTSSHSCHAYGYPGVLFLSKGGQGLTTATTRTTHDFFGTEPLTAITLAPGQTASFRLGVTHGAASPPSACVTAYALQMIPPNDTATLTTSIPNGGAFECGSATVSPLEPGTSAYK